MLACWSRILRIGTRWVPWHSNTDIVKEITQPNLQMLSEYPQKDAANTSIVFIYKLSGRLLRKRDNVRHVLLGIVNFEHAYIH